MRENKFKLYKLYEKWVLVDTVTLYQLNDYSDEIEQMEVVEFTGLKDKNGKEIYEGDIVENRKQYGAKGVVEYKAPYFMFQGGLGEYLLDRTVEVIGNIYENKELLE